MSDGSDQPVVRHVKAGTPAYILALHRVFDIEMPVTQRSPAPPVADLLARVGRRTVSIDLVLGAFRGDELVSAAVAVESPGAAALVYVPSRMENAAKYEATVRILRRLQTAAWERSLVLLETLVAPGALASGRALAEAGFRYLTRLRYLSRKVAKAGRPPNATAALEWVQYTKAREQMFLDAVERSYVQSLDCPELKGIRKTAEVLATHRATGIFDPGLWWLAKCGSESVGVILLNGIPGEPVLEIVYMGVAQPSRGTGVADALLHRAVYMAEVTGAKALALAVDERNLPARRVYERWNFAEVGARDAWIATSPCTEG